MIFVIGGAFQQKREVACKLFGYRLSDFVDGKDCTYEQIKNAKAVYNFHEFILQCMQEEQDLTALAEILQKENPDILIVSDEIGYGIVPMEQDMRAWRELTGRICCQIAALSDTVVRVVAGIPTVIKGEIK